MKALNSARLVVHINLVIARPLSLRRIMSAENINILDRAGQDGSTRNRLDLAPSRPFLKAPTSFSITSTKNIMSFGFDLVTKTNQLARTH